MGMRTASPVRLHAGRCVICVKAVMGMRIASPVRLAAGRCVIRVKAVMGMRTASPVRLTFKVPLMKDISYNSLGSGEMALVNRGLILKYYRSNKVNSLKSKNKF